MGDTSIGEPAAKAGRVAVTLAEVAAHAGVSKVAASVVLNNARSGTRVSPATRERIVSAAAELEYQPNAVARWLRQGRTDVIAFHNLHTVSFDLTYPFFGALIDGVQKGCELEHKDLLIHGRLRGRSDSSIFQDLHNGHVDGLVLLVHSVTPLIERVASSGLPVITVGEEVPGAPFVGVDEEAGGRLLARHLADKNLRRVLFRRGAGVLTPRLQQRVASFLAEAELLGLDIVLSPDESDIVGSLERELLLGPRETRPQAIACWSDYSADGITRFCLQSGLRVPQDVAIIGFDGLSPMHRPALLLTTVRAPWEEVGRTAVRLLVARHKGKEVPFRTILPVELAPGDTT